MGRLQRLWGNRVAATGVALAIAMLPIGFLNFAQSDEPAANQNKPLAAAIPAAAPKEPAANASPVGRRVPPLVLEDATGKLVGFSDFREKNFVAITFINCECPLSNQYLPVLNELQAKYAEKGLQLIAINSHAGNSKEKIATHAKEFGITFPVLCDPRQVAADVLGAQRTCETFLLDPQRYVRYHGRIDDRYQYTAKRDRPTRDDLTAALDELLEEKPVTVAETAVEGCLISRSRRAGKPGEITYAKQVSRIFREKCEVCHHPNTAAPFSLQTHEDTANWSAMIKEVVQQRRMPPWHADPRYGDFKEERRLSQEEIDTVVAWVNDGAPAGDVKDLPPAQTFPDGWKIGEPDVVFELPVEVPIKATGTIPYLYFKTPTNFKEDMWIQAAEARPGNRAAVHHILLFYEEPGKRPDLAKNWIDGAAPGNTPLQLPEGTGRRIPAGANLVWQMHYTSTGKPEVDRSQFAFKFCKEIPKFEAKVDGIANQRFAIPPGDSNYRINSSRTFDKDVLVYSFSPHMHMRGKDFEYRAIFPDGRNEIICSIPQYDFNWQAAYRLKKPLLLPKGTRIECAAYFDNSKWNPANPDPTKTVRWGDQTWEEMMIGYIDCVALEPDPTPPAAERE